MALDVGTGRPVYLEKGKHARGAGHLFPVDDERSNVDLPRALLPRITSGVRAAAADGPPLRVAHAPRFDAKDLSFLVGVAGLAGDVLQEAFLDVDVVVPLFVRFRWCGRLLVACGGKPAAQNGGERCPLDERYHVVGGWRAPKKGAPDPQ